MNTSQRGIDLIKRFEGLRRRAYQDTNGIWTIGYGHTGQDVRNGMVVTALEAEDLLRRDLREAEQAVESLVKADLSQAQFDALVSFVFNCGAGNFSASTLLRLVNEGNPRAAANQLLLWVHDQAGHRLAGLEKRRRAERDLFLEGTT